jgi:acyl-CoA synthetase (AMP-forming)/AMP-acid ligase II
MIFDGPGFLWGAAHGVVSRIPHRLSSSLAPAREADFPVEEVPASAPAVVTFTAGSTGRPKGVVRTHGLLSATRDILCRHTGGDCPDGPDLCIFPGLTMLNIAFGRTSLLISPWQRRSLAFLDALPAELAPQSMTVGPRFFERVLRECRLPALRRVVLGGAPADCSTVEGGLRRYPEARIDWLYGCTEAEPICVAAAGEALEKSRSCELAQVLWVGRPVPEIRLAPSLEGLWISGPHVSGAYLASPEENGRCKHTDADGVTWHNTGDRLLEDPPWAPAAAARGAAQWKTDRRVSRSPMGRALPGGDTGLWFAGRSSQPLEEFWAEQRLYAAVGHSCAFVVRDGVGSLIAYGEDIERHASAICVAVPQVRECRNMRAVRWDPRHRSRVRREVGRGRA